MDRKTSIYRPLFLAILIFVQARSGFADPSPPVQMLMNEPMSMFDWGIWRVDQKLKEMVRAEGDYRKQKLDRARKVDPKDPRIQSLGYDMWPISSTVFYDYTRNAIYVSLDAQMPLYSSDMKDDCKLYITMVKQNFPPKMDGSRLLGFFAHPGGYTVKRDHQSDIGREIDKLVRINVWVHDIFGEKKRGYVGIACSSPLLSDDIAYSERQVPPYEPF